MTFMMVTNLVGNRVAVQVERIELMREVVADDPVHWNECNTVIFMADDQIGYPIREKLGDLLNKPNVRVIW